MFNVIHKIHGWVFLYSKDRPMDFLFQAKVITGHMKKTCRHNSMGFTLIEIIAVLAILGILSLAVASRLNTTSTDLLTLQTAMKSHIRYAQSKAMQSKDSIWGIRFDRAASEYWLFNCDTGDACSWSTARTIPFGSEASEAAFNNDRIRTSQVNITIAQVQVGTSSKSQLTLVFNHMGVPFWLEGSTVTFDDPLSDTTGLTRLDDDILIQLQDTGGNARSITVTQETGFIQ